MQIISQNFFQKTIVLAVIAGSLILSGCSFKKKDPYERLNRGVFFVNRTADRLFVKPVAQAYDKFLPKPFRYVCHCFFENLREIPTFVNDMLQLKFREARKAAARFALNTTWGVGGLIDVATLGKIEKHNNDFGLTMAHYGYKESVYLVLPIFGPSTLRDAVGLYVNAYMGIWPYFRPTQLGWILYAVNLIDTRAKLLQAEPIIQEAAVDEYTFMKEAYLQHRRYEMNIDKDPVVGDLTAADLPDDNEASSQDSKDTNKSGDSDMPDDNEAISKEDKDKSEESKAEKPLVGAAAVAALQVDDIYNPNHSSSLLDTLPMTFDTVLYIAPRITPNLDIIKLNLSTLATLPETISAPANIPASSTTVPNSTPAHSATNTAPCARNKPRGHKRHQYNNRCRRWAEQVNDTKP